jgi:hypothetical protein
METVSGSGHKHLRSKDRGTMETTFAYFGLLVSDDETKSLRPAAGVHVKWDIQAWIENPVWSEYIPAVYGAPIFKEPYWDDDVQEIVRAEIDGYEIVSEAVPSVLLDKGVPDPRFHADILVAHPANATLLHLEETDEDGNPIKVAVNKVDYIAGVWATGSDGKPNKTETSKMLHGGEWVGNIESPSHGYL